MWKSLWRMWITICRNTLETQLCKFSLKSEQKKNVEIRGVTGGKGKKQGLIVQAKMTISSGGYTLRIST